MCVTLTTALRFTLATVVLVACLDMRAADQVKDVTASGFVFAKTTKHGEPLSFSLTIRNRTDQALQDVRFEQLPGNYELVKLCRVDPASKQPCVEQAAFPQAGPLIAPAVAPNSAAVVWGEFRPKKDHGTEAVVAFVGFKVATQTPAPNATPGATVIPSSPLPVNFGDNQVLSRWESSAWPAVMRALGIPVLLAFIAFLLNYVVKLRDERREESQKRESLKGETWKLMLPESHKYMTQHCLPLSLAAQYLADALESAEWFKAFFYILLVERRMDAARKAVGGFYFKELRAERLASGLWELRFNVLHVAEGSPQNLAIRKCVRLIRPAMAVYEDFVSRFPRTVDAAGEEQFDNSVMKEGFDALRTFFANADNVLELKTCMQALTALLDYEANRPYRFWYAEHQSIKFGDEALRPAIEAMLMRAGAEREMSPAEVDEYVAEAKQEWTDAPVHAGWLTRTWTRLRA